MNEELPDNPGRAKRTDVGYKRPPREHQFKAGQKPPPRKGKPSRRTVTETLMMILKEEVRVMRDGAPYWFTNAALVIEKAFQLAEKGNPTLSRALVDYLLAGETPLSRNDEPIIIMDPDGEFQGSYHYIRKVPL